MADNSRENERENSNNKRKVMMMDHEEFTGSNSGAGKRIRISDAAASSSSPAAAGSAESVTKSATPGDPEAIDLEVEKSETEICMISNADFSAAEELLISGGEMESPPLSPLPLISSTPERQSTTSSDSLPKSGSGGGGGGSDSGGSSSRSVVVNGVRMPSAAEIEDFFSAAEEYEQKRFAEKYNYDVVKDVPMEGKYKWIPLKL